MSFIFPLFTEQMFHSLGFRWANTIFAFAALAMAPLPIVSVPCVCHNVKCSCSRNREQILFFYGSNILAKSAILCEYSSTSEREREICDLSTFSTLQEK